jgi:hypothetical protein
MIWVSYASVAVPMVLFGWCLGVIFPPRYTRKGKTR